MQGNDLKMKLIADLSEYDAEELRRERDALLVDEAMVIATDLRYAHRVLLRDAFGRYWRMGFRGFKSGLQFVWTFGGRTSLEIEPAHRSLAFYVEKLERGEPFAFLRYGDLFSCVVGSLFSGYGFQQFTPKLREELAAGLRTNSHHSECIMGLAPIHHMVRMGLWGHTAAWLQGNDLTEVEWVETETFNQALYAGLLFPFVRALRFHEVLIVGPRKLKGLLGEALPGARFLEIPSRDAFSVVDRIEAEIRERTAPGGVVSLSAGPTAPILQHRLLETGLTTLSMGTTWEPFVGWAGHESHREITIATMAANLGYEIIKP